MSILDAITVGELVRRHADALAITHGARKAYATASLRAERGDVSGLEATRAALQAAAERERDIALALDETNAAAASRAENAWQSEQDRRWCLTAKHLEDRARHATALTGAIVNAAKAWKALVASSDAAARCAPQALDPGPSLLSPSALKSAADLEMARIGLPLRPEPWPFVPKPIPELAEQIVTANTYAMRPALRGPHQPTINQPEKSNV